MRRSKGKPKKSDLTAYLDRQAGSSPAAVGMSVAGVVATNGWLFLQFVQGRLTVATIVMAILIEAVVWTAMAEVQRARIKPGHRPRRTRRDATFGQLVVVWAAFVVGIGGAYALMTHLAGDLPTAFALLTDASAWRRTGLDGAVASTFVFATMGLVADRRWYEKHGPPFVSSIDLGAMARRLTFVYGAIPFAVPVIAATAGTIYAVRRVPKGWSSMAVDLACFAAILLALFGTMHLYALAIDAGPAGWAFAFLSTKCVVEGLFAAMPAIARRRQATRSNVMPAVSRAGGAR